METLLIGLFLGLFLEGKNHETPQNERRSQSETILCNCLPKPSQELRWQPDARRDSVVTDAVSKPYQCQ